MTNNESEIRILYISDTHLGIRGKEDEALAVFEEELKIASDNAVDLILHSGDFFDRVNADTTNVVSVINLLRTFLIESSPKTTLKCIKEDGLKYKCNLNMKDIDVKIPLFVINGNHDLKDGRSLCSLDILNEALLLNYFEPVQNIDEIILKPIILQKGSTKIVIYGCGHTEYFDESLVNGKFQLVIPSDGLQNYFSILMLHQDRKRNEEYVEILINLLRQKNYNINLLAWGHEHKYETVNPPGPYFNIIQIGSSINTQNFVECSKKFILDIKLKSNTEFTYETIPIYNFTHFYFDRISLGELGVTSTGDILNKVRNILTTKKNMLDQHDDSNLGYAIFLYIYTDGNYLCKKDLSSMLKHEFPNCVYKFKGDDRIEHNEYVNTNQEEPMESDNVAELFLNKQESFSIIDKKSFMNFFYGETGSKNIRGALENCVEQICQMDEDYEILDEEQAKEYILRNRDRILELLSSDNTPQVPVLAPTGRNQVRKRQAGSFNFR